MNEVIAHVCEQPKATHFRSAVKAPTDDSTPYGKALFDKLRHARRKLAEERGIPAFMVLHDSVLREISRRLPRSESELAAIRNVGRTRAADLGEAILVVVRTHGCAD